MTPSETETGEQGPEEAVEPRRAGPGGLKERSSRHTRQRAMYEDLMEEAVREENCERALAAVKRNQGAAGIDRMRKTACPVVWEGG